MTTTTNTTTNDARMCEVAEQLAAAHATDPLVREAGPAPEDAEDFDGAAMRGALREAGLPDGDDDVRALLVALRAALAAEREAWLAGRAAAEEARAQAVAGAIDPDLSADDAAVAIGKAIRETGDAGERIYMRASELYAERCAEARDRWTIESSSGAVLGAYPGATAEEALDAMARDAGYRSRADQCAATGDAPDDWTSDAGVFRRGSIGLLVRRVES